MRVTYDEIAESISMMGLEKAQKRLNYFKGQGTISLAEYMELWHLVNIKCKRMPDPRQK